MWTSQRCKCSCSLGLPGRAGHSWGRQSCTARRPRGCVRHLRPSILGCNTSKSATEQTLCEHAKSRSPLVHTISLWYACSATWRQHVTRPVVGGVTREQPDIMGITRLVDAKTGWLQRPLALLTEPTAAAIWAHNVCPAMYYRCNACSCSRVAQQHWWAAGTLTAVVTASHCAQISPTIPCPGRGSGGGGMPQPRHMPW